MKDIRERVLFVIKLMTDDYGRYTTLERRTAVKAHKWANLYSGKQKPTVEMIEALGKLAPGWVEWVITGKSGTKQEAPKATLEVVEKLVRQELSDERRGRGDGNIGS